MHIHGKHHISYKSDIHIKVCHFVENDLLELLWFYHKEDSSIIIGDVQKFLKFLHEIFKLN